MTTVETFGRRIAEFAATGARGSVAPFHVEAFLNWFGCALAGADSQAVDKVVEFYAEDSASDFAPPIGRSEQLSASAAVAVDCLSSACLAFDDIHFATTLHPTGPVAAAILGLARTRPVAGADALEALRLGTEVECRMALAMLGSSTDSAKGWYPTGLVGGIGAAAAVGRLLGFDAARMETALGLAATQASGTRGTHGAMAAFWVPAVAAESGFVAARLAERGFSCSIGALTGTNGLLRQIAPRPNLEAALDGLGERYICEDTASKPYPFGFIAYGAVTCCLELHETIPSLRHKIAELVLEVSPTAALLGSKTVPDNLFEAHVSLSYIAARVLSDPGSADEPLRDAFSVDDSTVQLARRVSVKAAPDLEDQQCRATARLLDGRYHVAFCQAAPGAPGNLPSSDNIRGKFLRLATGAAGAAAAENLLDRLVRLSELDDIARLLTPSLGTGVQ